VQPDRQGKRQYHADEVGTHTHVLKETKGPRTYRERVVQVRNDTDRTLLAQQDAWVAQQHHEQYAQPAAASSTPTAPAAQATPTAPTAPATTRFATDPSATNPVATGEQAPLPVSAFAASGDDNDTSPSPRFGQPVG